MDALKDHIIETQNKMYAAEGSGDLEEFRRLSDYRNGLMDALKLVESPWTYLIDAEGEDTGKRPPIFEWVTLSVTNLQRGWLESFKARWNGRQWEVYAYDSCMILGDYEIPYAFQPWPEPAPYPMEVE